MATEMPKTPEAKEALKELLQFEIDKTHESLFETGKSLGTAFLTYLLLVAVTALLVYGRVEDNVELPLLTVKVSKELAAAITVLLCQIVQIWLISLLMLQSSLIDRLNFQLRDRFDRGSLESWYLQYPSPFHSVQFLVSEIPGSFGNFIGSLLAVAYSFIVAFFPISFSIIIARNADFPASLKYPWSITNTLLNLSVMVGMSVAALQRYRAQKRVNLRTRLYSEIGKAQDDLEKAQHDLKKGYEELEERMRDFSEIQSQFLERVRSSTNTTQTRGDSEGKQPDVDKS